MVFLTLELGNESGIAQSHQEVGFNVLEESALAKCNM